MFIDRDREKTFSERALLFFKRFFIVMGVAATIVFIMLFSTLHKLVNYVPPSLPEKIVLTYTFKSGLTEKVGRPSLSQPLLRPATTFHEIVEDLDHGAKDPRVKGFVARLQDINMAPAQLQEMRDTVARFRAAGKFAWVFTENFGGMRSGLGSYYLASAFDRVWLQPIGTVAITGLSAEVPFLKGMLDKIGVTPQFARRGIYKSVPESLTDTGMSAPHREMMTSLINDLTAQMTAGISESRKMPLEDVRRIMNAAPYTDREALDLRLIDRLGYYDQVIEDARKESGGDSVDLQGYSFNSNTTSLNLGITGFVSRFFRKSDPAYATRNKAKIALILASGDITAYKGGTGMVADKIAAAFETAAKDADVASIIFRIDSPGGAPSAAETIRRSVQRAQQRGKPVIVSMGGYAASGGYWIAAPADKIVAEPGTITGSIGVFGGKFSLLPLWEKIGVNWESVSAGGNAGMWSLNREFSDAEKQRFGAMLANIYESFIDRVAAGRKMTRDQALAVAEGRAWTGRQAKENGLVDALGGLETAVTLAKEAAKLPPEQDVPVERFPPPKSTLETFIQLATEGVAASPLIGLDAEELLQQAASRADSYGNLLKMPELQF